MPQMISSGAQCLLQFVTSDFPLRSLLTIIPHLPGQVCYLHQMPSPSQSSFPSKLKISYTSIHDPESKISRDSRGQYPQTTTVARQEGVILLHPPHHNLPSMLRLGVSNICRKFTHTFLSIRDARQHAAAF